MDKLDIKPLGEIMTLHRGYDLPEADRNEGPVPVYGSSGITGWHDKAKLTGQNVITGRTGTIGEVFYAVGKCWPLNTTLFVSDFHGNNPMYVAYLLEYLFKIAKLDGSDKSTVPGVDRNAIHPINIPFEPDFDCQTQMIAILKSIDSLVDNNKTVIKELEDSARLIYDYWFTQFDFPDESGRPYRSSGGKMVWNNELKREIPEGWEVKTIGESCVIKLGGTPDTERSEYWDGEIPWLSSAEIASNPALGSEKKITEEGMKHSATEFSPSGSIALSITRYLRAAILAVDSCFNQSVVTLEENNLMKKEFLFPLVVSNIPYFMVLRTGAQQPHINKETVAETKFVMPAEDILNKYYQAVSALYEKIIATARENKQLLHLRDWLLPMLMNGQVQVSKI